MNIIIEMPNEDVKHTFTNFNKAIRFCEKEFGYGKEIETEKWKEIKQSKSVSSLKEFLWNDGLWVELQ